MGVKYHKAPLPSVCSSIAETGKKIQYFLSAHRENHAPAEAGRTAKIFCKTGRPFIPALCGICRLQKGLSPAHLFPAHGTFFPKASPSALAYGLRGACKGLLSACGSKCRAFPFPPGPQARGHCFSAGGAALVTRRWQPAPPGAGGKIFLQATTGRAGAARALCPFPKQNTRARREKLQTGQNTGESCGRSKS